MEGKTGLNFIDINSVSSKKTNPKKAWIELIKSLLNIYKNFQKSEIHPEELECLFHEDEKNKNNVPDVQSIDYLINTIKRYIQDYKIPGTTTLFLEFKRHSAIYLFSIGSTEKATTLLKDILAEVYENCSGGNIDINLVCVKDCVKLNQASIHFWLEDYEEARLILEEIITYYESSTEDLYLIKMVNFISIAFTYLAWIFLRKNQYDDAEKSFLHSMKVISTVKAYTKEKLKEAKFIDSKVKKIFIYGN
jgi:hypothetical protein